MLHTLYQRNVRANTQFYIDSIVPSTTHVIGTIPLGRDVSVSFDGPVTSCRGRFTTRWPAGNTGGSAPLTIDYHYYPYAGLPGTVQCLCYTTECFSVSDPIAARQINNRLNTITDVVSIAPNPASQSVTFSLNSQSIVDEPAPIGWQLYDNMGTLVNSGNSYFPLTIDVSRLRKGLYRFVTNSTSKTLRVE
jgi:hypothetical protein